MSHFLSSVMALVSRRRSRRLRGRRNSRRVRKRSRRHLMGGGFDDYQKERQALNAKLPSGITLVSPTDLTFINFPHITLCGATSHICRCCNKRTPVAEIKHYDTYGWICNDCLQYEAIQKIVMKKLIVDTDTIAKQHVLVSIPNASPEDDAVLLKELEELEALEASEKTPPILGDEPVAPVHSKPLTTTGLRLFDGTTSQQREKRVAKHKAQREKILAQHKAQLNNLQQFKTIIERHNGETSQLDKAICSVKQLLKKYGTGGTLKHRTHSSKTTTCRRRPSLPLHRRRRLRAHIVHHPPHPLHLPNHPRRHCH